MAPFKSFPTVISLICSAGLPAMYHPSRHLATYNKTSLLNKPENSASSASPTKNTKKLSTKFFDSSQHPLSQTIKATAVLFNKQLLNTQLWDFSFHKTCLSYLKFKPVMTTPGNPADITIPRHSAAFLCFDATKSWEFETSMNTVIDRLEASVKRYKHVYILIGIPYGDTNALLRAQISLFSRQLFPRLHPVHNAKECLDLVLSILAITAKEAQSKILSNFQKHVFELSEICTNPNQEINSNGQI